MAQLGPKVIEVNSIEFGLHSLFVYLYLLLLDLHFNLLEPLLVFGGALLPGLFFGAAAILKF